jgi:solute carrier family 30 (zinc transporter), member 1
MSLIIALYAIKLTKSNVVSSKYSYGWHRAEILAALINGVFLLALCFSILMEAIERLFSVPGGLFTRRCYRVASWGY